jgi:hypothetical protein
MNNNDPQDRLDFLFDRARQQYFDTSTAEFAFETRLLAHLRGAKSVSSPWVMVSWRLIPFFAVSVVALALWHAEVVTETNDAEQVAYVENPDSLSSWSSFN